MRNDLLVQLPDLEACVVASGKEVAVFGGSKDPIPISLSLLGLDGGFGFVVPYFQRFVLAVADQGVGLFIEEHAGNVVLMPWNGGVFPGYFVGVLPQFDLAVV